MPRIVKPDSLPILTEMVDGSMLDLPTLTDAIEEHITVIPSAFPLTDEQCQQLAEQLFPALEATLRDAIGSRSEARWEKAMQQLHSTLPELIRSVVHKPR